MVPILCGDLTIGNKQQIIITILLYIQFCRSADGRKELFLPIYFAYGTESEIINKSINKPYNIFCIF